MRNKLTIFSGAIVLTGIILMTVACSQQTSTRGFIRPKNNPQPTSAQEPTSLKYHAIVIGISDYTQHGGNGWEKLHTARNDAIAVADSLEQRYDFEVTRLLDQDATRDAILVALDSISSLSPNDAALIYFAGHGYYDENLGEGYWIPVDAQKKNNGRFTKEDWIWNTMVTKVIGASAARHVLVIADSCYGGSMFRGESLGSSSKNLTWYQRALNKPSRYLITSGDIEPVLDSGNRNSIFAHELLNFLNYPEARIFAASDLALSLRDKVSALTGQMVRMGPLAVASHSGGEFIFVSKGAKLPPLKPEDQMFVAGLQRSGQDATTSPVKIPEAQSSGDKTAVLQAMQDVVLLRDQGATNAAQKLFSNVLSAHGEDQLVQAVASYLNNQRRVQQRDELRLLIEQVAAHKKNQPQDQTAKSTNAPIILACLGPTSLSGSSESEAMTALVRIALRTELEQKASLQIVEREALEDVLQELNIGSSELADNQAQLTVGKLLPASLLLLGNLLDTPSGSQLYLRLVDTQTTRIIGSFSALLSAQDLATQCSQLAQQVTDKVQSKTAVP
jgi:hypothetical protein